MHQICNNQVSGSSHSNYYKRNILYTYNRHLGVCRAHLRQNIPVPGVSAAISEMKPTQLFKI